MEVQRSWGVFPDVGEFWSVAEKLAGYGLVAAVVSWVYGFSGSFDDLSEDVQSFGLEEGDKGLLRGDYIARVYRVDDSVLESVHVSYEVGVVRGQGDVVGATSELESVGVVQVWVVRGLHVLVVDFVDWSQTVRQSLEVVVGHQLVVDVVVD